MKLTEMYLRLKYQNQKIEVLTLEQFEKEGHEVCFDEEVLPEFMIRTLTADCEDCILIQISPVKRTDHEEFYNNTTYAKVHKYGIGFIQLNKEYLEHNSEYLIP